MPKQLNKLVFFHFTLLLLPMKLLGLPILSLDRFLHLPKLLDLPFALAVDDALWDYFFGLWNW